MSDTMSDLVITEQSLEVVDGFANATSDYLLMDGTWEGTEAARAALLSHIAALESENARLQAVAGKFLDSASEMLYEHSGEWATVYFDRLALETALAGSPKETAQEAER